MGSFNKVGANVLFVQDLDTMMKFYRDILGLELAFSDDVSHAFKMDGQDFALVHVSAGVEMLNAEVLAPSPSHRFMLCADIADCDAFYNELTAKGIQFIQPPKDQDWGFRTAYLADPEGNLWEFRETIPRK